MKSTLSHISAPRASLAARQARRIRWRTGTSEQTAYAIADLLHGEARK